MATYSSNVTKKTAPFFATETYASGSVVDDVVYETADGEYLELNSVNGFGNAGNGGIFKIKNMDTGGILYSNGSVNSTAHPAFTANLRGNYLLVPPRHQILYSNAVVVNTGFRVGGFKTINTP